MLWFKGAMKVDAAVHLRIARALSAILPAERIKVVKGFFQDTLPANLPSGKPALVHLDCDLYDSARYVLDTLLQNDLLQDGMLLVLDDYNCNRANPRMGERRALAEAFAAQTSYAVSPWFPYGWHGQVFFVHANDGDATAFKAAGGAAETDR